jgi:FkbM family methyltransferase
VDVGANQGLYTLLFSRLVGPTGHVYALEPEPVLFAALEANCRINNTANVTPLRMAAGDTRSQGLLRCSRLNRGDNRLAADARGRAVAVKIVPLDEIVPAGPVSFVKIDVQGYEPRVVNGMRSLIDQSPAMKVLFEFWPAGLSQAGHTPAELLDFFLGRGFGISELSAGGLRKLRGSETAQLARAGGSGYRNLLAARDQVSIQ